VDISLREGDQAGAAAMGEKLGADAPDALFALF